MEAITGPVHGFYLAAYAVESDGGFMGHARIYRERPSDVWASTPALKKMSAGPFPDPQAAVQGVIERTSLALALRELVRSCGQAA